jgi:hypothetical protein
VTEVRNGVLVPDGIVGGVDVERDFSPRKGCQETGEFGPIGNSPIIDWVVGS